MIVDVGDTLPGTCGEVFVRSYVGQKAILYQYEQRVREVEHASFTRTPLVLSATGGMANEATVFYKRLASCLTTK